MEFTRNRLIKSPVSHMGLETHTRHLFQ